MRPMIEIEGLWKAFGRVEVLKGVSLAVERGGVVAIMGVGGGFFMVPAMIYLLGMPTSLVP